MPRAIGSLFNVFTYKFVKEHDRTLKIQRVSRKGLSYEKGAPAALPSNIVYSVADEDLVQLNETAASLQAKVQFVADHIKTLLGSEDLFVVYTGAGLSTSANIPDFRGPNGVWTNRDRGLKAPKCIPMEEAVPTFSHRALTALYQERICDLVVSQNVDGLHLRSGLNAAGLAELHGNCFLEQCVTCQTSYLRDFDVCRWKGPHFRTAIDHLSPSGISHITGRVCDAAACVAAGKAKIRLAQQHLKLGVVAEASQDTDELDLGHGKPHGMLRDSIIHFGENLPPKDLQIATSASRKAKLALTLGTSLHVTPAADLPYMVDIVLNCFLF